MGEKPKVLYQSQSESSVQIEILTVQTGMEFYDCYARREVEKLDGVMIYIIGLQDLKKIKQAGDRPKDREDLIHLA